jgi:hypothetical protein
MVLRSPLVTERLDAADPADPEVCVDAPRIIDPHATGVRRR